MNQLSLTLIALAAVATISGCASSQRQNVYQTGTVQQQMRIKTATVLEVREVDIEVRPSGAGALAGTAAGSTLATGSGRGGVVEGIAGAVIGGIAGHLVEKGMSGKKGQEVIYQVDGTPETLALVQELDDNPLRPGDRVRLIEGAFSARLVRLAAAR